MEESLVISINSITIILIVFIRYRMHVINPPGRSNGKNVQNKWRLLCKAPVKRRRNNYTALARAGCWGRLEDVFEGRRGEMCDTCAAKSYYCCWLYYDTYSYCCKLFLKRTILVCTHQTALLSFFGRYTLLVRTF